MIKIVSATPINSTGWAELMDGNIISAAFVMFDTAWKGWFIAILFFVYQFMLYMKTRNPTICWISGLFFLSLYASITAITASGYVVLKQTSLQFMFLISIFQLGAIFYMLFWK